tara:strand:+ start:513 stop:968 length:456 start_codon:yes stop_codon:yes gene_type:complete
MFKNILTVGIWLFFLLPSLPVKTHFLEQTEEECKKIELRVFNCEFRRIRKPNNTHSDFKYKFAYAKKKNPSSLDKYKRYPLRKGAAYSHRYAMIIIEFDNNKIIREKGIISTYPNIYYFQSKNVVFLVGTSCKDIWYKNKKIESVCKQDFW